MGTLQVSAGEAKKNLKICQEETSLPKDQFGNSVAEKKENVQPGMKREYELLERYIRNFSGSSF